MDFISEYFYVIILIVGAIAQWLKSRSEAKDAGGGYHPEEHRHDPEELEEFEREAERRNARPAVPPPLPPSGGAMPGLGRSPVPDLRRNSPPVAAAAAPYLDASAELARQQALMDQAGEFKRAKIARKAKAAPLLSPAKAARPAVGIRGRLHNRSEIRSAFVLKEILEKPIGLR